MPIVGDVLADRYRIESILGVGGMASVYRATDLRLDRPVAVKVLAANLAADVQLAERFNREAGAMAGFSHPNVAAVYDVEVADPTTGREPFYVMEFCPQGSLADRLKVGGRMLPAELGPIVAAVSDGLAELHRNGLIHRDVKPANILFASDRPKLADFGVAWSQGPRDGDPLTMPGSMVGTGPYLAPELRAGEPPSAASDVYALGVTTFQALTGQYPQLSTVAESNDDSPSAALLRVSAAAPDLGLRFDDLLARALDVDPAARPSPVAFAAELTIRLENWGVARPNPWAVAAPDPAGLAVSGVDMEAPTRVAQERPMPQPASPQAAVSQSTLSPLSRTGYRGRAVLVAILVVTVVLAVPRLLGGNPGFPVASPAAPAEASPTASAPLSATTPSSDTEATLAALSLVDGEIEAARGGKDGLKGRDGNELSQLAISVRTSVDSGDLGAAAMAAQALSDRARELATDLDESRRDSLLVAIDGLMAALSAD